MSTLSWSERVAAVLTFCGSLMIATAPARAQGTSAAGITGVVKDASGGVLPGVTVEVASPALIEKVRTAITDERGQYQNRRTAAGHVYRHVLARRFRDAGQGGTAAHVELHRHGERRAQDRRDSRKR